MMQDFKYFARSLKRRMTINQHLKLRLLMVACRRVLVEKIKRAKFVGRKWMTSTNAFQQSWSQMEFGWNREDARKKIGC